jgi:hypothetical protein
VDEDAVKALGLPPRELAERLAIAKADALLASEPGAILIGCDQVATIDGEALDKPGTPRAGRGAAPQALGADPPPSSLRWPSAAATSCGPTPTSSP